MDCVRLCWATLEILMPLINMVNKTYPENIIRIQFLETEKMSKIEKCDFLSVTKSPGCFS